MTSFFVEYESQRIQKLNSYELIGKTFYWSKVCCWSKDGYDFTPIKNSRRNIIKILNIENNVVYYQYLYEGSCTGTETLDTFLKCTTPHHEDSFSTVH